jgi:hypothetical protein
MDFHYNNEQFVDGRLDFHRFVLLVTHRFSDRIRFVGELEVEHAFVEGLEAGGEVELEQAYVDFLFSRSFNIRAGMLLLPIGIINQRHEPPTYLRRTALFDTFIIPTTWFEAGAGVQENSAAAGVIGHTLRATERREVQRRRGIREGRQKGSGQLCEPHRHHRPPRVCRHPGLTTGASFFVGIPASNSAPFRRAGEAVRPRRAILSRSAGASRRGRVHLDTERR